MQRQLLSPELFISLDDFFVILIIIPFPLFLHQLHLFWLFHCFQDEVALDFFLYKPIFFLPLLFYFTFSPFPPFPFLFSPFLSFSAFFLFCPILDLPFFLLKVCSLENSFTDTETQLFFIFFLLPLTAYNTVARTAGWRWKRAKSIHLTSFIIVAWKCNGNHQS